MPNELYRDYIDGKADEIINSLGGTITPAPDNAELYRDFLDRKFDDVITAITNISTGGVLSGDTAPNNADGDNNDLYVQYDSSYNVVALYVKLNNIWRFISTTGSSHTYSTTEHVVGTWIDGRPVYEITVSGTLTSSPTVIFIGADYNVDIYIEVMPFLENPYNNFNYGVVGTAYCNGSHYLGAYSTGPGDPTTELRLYYSGNYSGNNTKYTVTIRYVKKTN